MPKIIAIDAKTGQPSGAIETGRHIKAKTQTMSTQLVPETAQPQIEGQPAKDVGSSPEAKPLDPKYEALAKKESAIRTREKEFQAREASFKEKEAKLAAAEAFQERLRQNPLDVLNEIGVTYDQLVEQAVNGPDQKTRDIQKKLDAIEAAQKKQSEDIQNSAKAQRDSAINQIRNDAKDLVETSTEFETIKATESAEDVVELITRTFDETGKLLTVEDAAKMVEEELFAEAIRIANIGKVKAKLTPAVVEASKQQSGQQQQKMTTLTNNMTSTRPMTARERAIARFKGEKF